MQNGTWHWAGEGEGCLSIRVPKTKVWNQGGIAFSCDERGRIQGVEEKTELGEDKPRGGNGVPPPLPSEVGFHHFDQIGGHFRLKAISVTCRTSAPTLKGPSR